MPHLLKIVKFLDVNFDLQAIELPDNTLSFVKNARYDNNAFCRTNGHFRVFDSGMLFDPYFALGVRQPLGYSWVYAGATAIGVVDISGVHNDITPVAGVSASYADNWVGGIINGVPYLSSPTSNPIFWDGVVSNKMVDITGWPANTKAKAIRTYRNFLIALDLTESSVEYPNRIRWSSSAEAGDIPQSWDETAPALDAGFISLGGTEGALIDCLPLYENNIIYKNNSTYIMSYTGGQQLFSFRELFQDVGIIGRNCAAYFKGKHAVFTQDDLIVHDGRTARSIVDKRLRNFIFNSIHPSFMSQSFVVPYHKKDEIWFCFPSGAGSGGASGSGVADTAVIWNYKDDKCSLRDLQDSPYIGVGVIDKTSAIVDWDTDTEPWDFDTSVWNEQLSGSVSQELLMCSGSYLHKIDDGTTFDGEDYPSVIERLSMPITEDYSRVKLIKSLRPHFTGSSGSVIKIRVGGQMNVDDPISWGQEQDFIVGVDDRFYTFVKGLYLSISISSDSGSKWALHTVGIEYSVEEVY